MQTHNLFFLSGTGTFMLSIENRVLESAALHENEASVFTSA